MEKLNSKDLLDILQAVTTTNSQLITNQSYLKSLVKELSVTLKEAVQERTVLKDVVCDAKRVTERTREEQIGHNKLVDTLADDVQDLIDQTTNFTKEDAKTFNEVSKILKEMSPLNINFLVTMLSDIEEVNLVKKIKNLIITLKVILSILGTGAIGTALYMFAQKGGN